MHLSTWMSRNHTHGGEERQIRATQPGVVEDDAGVDGGGGADDDDDDIDDDGAQEAQAKMSQCVAHALNPITLLAESFGPQNKS